MVLKTVEVGTVPIQWRRGWNSWGRAWKRVYKGSGTRAARMGLLAG